MFTQKQPSFRSAWTGQRPVPTRPSGDPSLHNRGDFFAESKGIWFPEFSAVHSTRAVKVLAKNAKDRSGGQAFATADSSQLKLLGMTNI